MSVCCKGLYRCAVLVCIVIDRFLFRIGGERFVCGVIVNIDTSGFRCGIKLAELVFFVQSLFVRSPHVFCGGVVCSFVSERLLEVLFCLKWFVIFVLCGSVEYVSFSNMCWCCFCVSLFIIGVGVLSGV